MKNKRHHMITIIHILIPVFLAMVLFICSLYFIVMPVIRDHFLLAKKEMIKELTYSVYNLLVHYEQRVEEGELSLEESQRRSMKRIEEMRYGGENKDYFWINDLRPFLLMHPYRKDLEGKNVGNFTDSRGKYLFRDFVRVAREQGEGYVDYMWQWKDDAQRIVPKISFVKLFKPWGWIIGTGIYTNDVEVRIDTLVRRLYGVFAGIIFLLFIISLYIVQYNIRLEKERHNAERAQENLTRQLMAANKEMEEYCYIISHDLRAPIVSLQGFVGIVREGIEALRSLVDRGGEPQVCASVVENEIKKPVTYIETSAAKLQRLLDGFLRILRISGERLDYKKIDMDLLMKNVCDVFKFQIESKQVHVIIEEALPWCIGDALHIEQVFANIIDNALKYARQDGEKKITVSGRLEHGKALYCVEDNGIGIEPHAHTKVFDMFYQSHPQESDGAGVGMTLVKKIVKKSGGEIWFESQAGSGTRFYVLLPRTVIG